MAEVLPREESSLSLLVNNQRLSDVEILIGKDKVPVYATKAILSVNSEYFNEVFFCQPEPGTNGKLEFPGIESDTFLRFLNVSIFKINMSCTPQLFLTSSITCLTCYYYVYFFSSATQMNST